VIRYRTAFVPTPADPFGTDPAGRSGHADLAAQIVEEHPDGTATIRVRSDLDGRDVMTVEHAVEGFSGGQWHDVSRVSRRIRAQTIAGIRNLATSTGAPAGMRLAARAILARGGEDVAQTIADLVSVAQGAGDATTRALAVLSLGLIVETRG